MAFKEDPIVATSITKANPAVVTASSSSGNVLVKGQLLRVVSTDMAELKGAIVQVTGFSAAGSFEISVDSSGFTSEATEARMQAVAPEAIQSYKILGVGGANSFILSNIEGITAGMVLTIASGKTSLLPLDNKRVKVVAIDSDTFAIFTNVNIMGLGKYELPTAVGEISTMSGFAYLQPTKR